MTDAESATLKDWLRDELKAGKIRPSKSSISSPVMFVPKKDGSRCLVVDYRRLNNRTKKNVYPLPRPDDLMAQLRGAKIFTKLDLRWGYNNVRVKEGDEWKTAFRTKYGLYESLVMTFGLTNAPAAFQHFMNELFKDLLDVCVIIYLDDILIYSKDDASHTQHVHEVLRRLMGNQLFCKASKCTFHVTSVEYLGIIVSDKGFSLDKLKIQAVQEWPVPTKVKEVQSPLHNLVKKDTPWKWDVKEQEAFQGLKDAITNAPVLCHADPSKPYFLETDASGAALGSILSQRQEDGRLHPLGFLSTIIRSFEYWRIFLEGTVHPVTVFTDHRNLEYWKESRTFNRRHARWHLLLAGYNFQIVYRPGKQSGKPDALSRRSDHANIPPEPQTMLPDPVFANVALITPEKELQRQIEASLDQDESLEEILQFLQNESKAPPSIKQRSKITKWRQAYSSIREGLWYQILELYGQIYSAYSTTALWPDTRVDKEHWNYSRIGGPLPAHVWKKYGMPEKTISDRGRVFNNKFLKALYKRLGIDPHFSSAYHPQSDGQTERVNPTVEHFLRAYSGVNQKDWVKWLPMAEFAYNNAVHSSTGKSPFKALHGWEPSLTPSNVPTDVPEADDIASQMESQWREIEAALRQSKARMTAGETGEPISFEEGEEAWLDARNVKLKTLSPKDDKRAFENRPPPVTVDGEEEYEVEGITDMENRNGKWFFRVKWKGYGSEENTWEPRENLKNAEKILKKFEKEMKEKALGAAKALKGGAVSTVGPGDQKPPPGYEPKSILGHRTSGCPPYRHRHHTGHPQQPQQQHHHLDALIVKLGADIAKIGTAAASGSSIALATKAPKLATPDKFDGISYPGSTVDEQIAFIISCLDGKAHEWLEPYLEEDVVKGNPNFRAKLRTLKQTKGVQDYYKDFQTYSQGLGYNNPSLRDMFYDGLSHKIKETLMVQDYDHADASVTLATLAEKALKVDQRLEQFAAQHKGSSSSSNQSGSNPAPLRQQQPRERPGINCLPIVKWNDGTTMDVTFKTIKKDNHPVTATSTPAPKASSSSSLRNSGPSPMDLDSASSKGKKPIICATCGGRGHYANQCPSKSYSGHEAHISEDESENGDL
ncbi:hypothetical protein RHS01_06466 [Rhizoctonia solani]|uniref:Retrotransposable element Tf2 155 kDa protein type 1 n=1 Tax=Rhizoctonia solani TaxID=456999 RepID=A0A8H7IBK8_9AGAM|nr:hypothetical protein RHS01_06466 [Rhizoctonia solani]